MNTCEQLIDKAEKNNSLTKEELVQILGDDSCNDLLFAAADRTRHKFVGDEVHLRALIEISNICKQNCLYCGLRRDNKHIERYKLEKENIISLAKKACEFGYKTVVMQSGESDCYSDTEMIDIITNVKATGLAITLSIGEKSAEQYRKFKEAGADRFLLRIETTDNDIYKYMHPGQTLENRIYCLEALKEYSFEVGTGCLVGLPGQQDESLAGDILFFKEIDADMIGLGPFIPNEETPLGKMQGGTFNKALKVMALTRLLCPDTNIPATTAMETLRTDGRALALQSGANVIMPNMTDEDHKILYQLYPGKISMHDSAKKIGDKVKEKIHKIGRTVSLNAGYRRKK